MYDLNWLGMRMWSMPRPCLCPHLVMYGVCGLRWGMMDMCVAGCVVSFVMRRCFGGGCRVVPMVWFVGSGACD